jgi:hypothetical protein
LRVGWEPWRELADRARQTRFWMMNHRLFHTLAALLLALPLLYALSAGPALYLKTSGRLGLSEEVFAWFYHPLIRAEERIPAFGRAMHWYVGLWHNEDSPAAVLEGRVTQCRIRRRMSRRGLRTELVFVPGQCQ